MLDNLINPLQNINDIPCNVLIASLGKIICEEKLV
jgi:hypothetical protein